MTNKSTNLIAFRARTDEALKIDFLQNKGFGKTISDTVRQCILYSYHVKNCNNATIEKAYCPICGMKKI